MELYNQIQPIISSCVKAVCVIVIFNEHFAALKCFINILGTSGQGRLPLLCLVLWWVRENEEENMTSKWVTRDLEIRLVSKKELDKKQGRFVLKKHEGPKYGGPGQGLSGYVSENFFNTCSHQI